MKVGKVGKTGIFANCNEEECYGLTDEIKKLSGKDKETKGNGFSTVNFFYCMPDDRLIFV